MTTSIIVGELRTGRRITQIPVSGASFSVLHRATGDVSIDIPLGATEFRDLERQWFGARYFGDGMLVGPTSFPVAATPVWLPGQGMRAEFLSAVDPLRCFLAIADGDHIYEGGPIWQHAYNAGTDVLTVRAGGMRSIFDYRLVLGLLASWPNGNPAEWEQVFGGLSLGTIAKRLVQLAQQYTGGELPIDLPADAGGSHERTFKGFELPTVLSVLDALMGVQGGPDIAFEPYFAEDGAAVRWRMRTGTPADPLVHQAGGDHIFDASVPKSPVKGINVTVDATKVNTRKWEIGSGIDKTALMAFDEDLALVQHGYPFTETAARRTSVEEQPTLDAWASGDLASTLRATQTWTFDVEASALRGARCGDWAMVKPPASNTYLRMRLPVSQQGYRARIVGLRGGLGRFVTVTCMPTMEVR